MVNEKHSQLVDVCFLERKFDLKVYIPYATSIEIYIKVYNENWDIMGHQKRLETCN